jgi:hypothetical protein
MQRQVSRLAKLAAALPKLLRPIRMFEELNNQRGNYIEVTAGATDPKVYSMDDLDVMSETGYQLIIASREHCNVEA